MYTPLCTFSGARSGGGSPGRSLADLSCPLGGDRTELEESLDELGAPDSPAGGPRGDPGLMGLLLGALSATDAEEADEPGDGRPVEGFLEPEAGSDDVPGAHGVDSDLDGEAELGEGLGGGLASAEGLGHGSISVVVVQVRY
jgi:hypothetical protein